MSADRVAAERESWPRRWFRALFPPALPRIDRRIVHDAFLAHHADGSAYVVDVFRGDRLLRFTVPIHQSFRLERYMLVPQPDASPAQLENRARWIQIG